MALILASGGSKVVETCKVAGCLTHSGSDGNAGWYGGMIDTTNGNVGTVAYPTYAVRVELTTDDGTYVMDRGANFASNFVFTAPINGTLHCNGSDIPITANTPTIFTDLNFTSGTKPFYFE